MDLSSDQVDDIADIVNFLQLSDRLATAGQPTIEQYPAIATAGYQVVINLALTDSPSALVDEQTIARSLGLEYIHSTKDMSDTIR